MTPVVVSGPKETDLAKQVEGGAADGRIVLSQPSLKGFYELAKRAQVYIGGDTGPTHLALAAGAPVVGIFGPTEWWRNGSTEIGDICVERNDIGCRTDCHRRACSKWICMDIDVENVFSAVRSRIAITQKASKNSLVPSNIA
jgi:ADP-heptose:LPS heptosyltransferase